MSKDKIQDTYRYLEIPGGYSAGIQQHSVQLNFSESRQIRKSTSPKWLLEFLCGILKQQLMIDFSEMQKKIEF